MTTEREDLREANRPARMVLFDDCKPVRIYRRDLPHWRQNGCTYFVTFRLAGSVPRNVAREWAYELAKWVERYRQGSRVDHEAWRQSFAMLPESWRRRLATRHAEATKLPRAPCCLSDDRCIAAIRDALFTGDGRQYHLGDFVVMPNHVHALIIPEVKFELELIMKLIKGRSANACNRVLCRQGALWQSETYDHIVRDLGELAFYREYIVENAKRAGIVLPPTAMYRATWMDAWFRQHL